ncbi:hypothetical protein GE061_018092 [Apolygus lucorum]|uniref:Uncharacterized protein n=1 Tax=Apolygus lucorum TaxID=248454 RepID=A0A8S9XFJ6_APOLU|nr:hypothetical protein GE061_018092 [Apolygus lucorum]
MYRSQEIDKMLEKERHSFRRQVKLLLLGAGESGKSTFLKQMRIIHGIKFEPELIKEFQQVVYQNIVKGMKVQRELYPEIRQQHYAGHQTLHTLRPPTLADLWNDSGIKRAFERRREFQLSDSVQYFLDNIDRISRVDYIPTNKDILHARKATKGISEFTIPINNIPFRFVDVGGQRSQRQKWFQCFDSVTSILFLVSSSEFDQVLVEDRKTNRLEESRNIFDTIVNNLIFRGVSIILFLNKTDLLESKLKSGETSIRWFFPDFPGDEKNLTDVQNFLLEYFRSAKRDPKKHLFYHFTTAVDTENIKVVFNAVKDTILHRNLESLMLQ